jgi:hypothetical protein
MPGHPASLWSLEYLMGRWQPAIGDPSFMGWFTVAAYLDRFRQVAYGFGAICRYQG